MTDASPAPGTRGRPRADETVSAAFEGAPLEAPAGASVAAALISTGRTSWRDSREGAPRGLFCGIGVCFDCIVEIDGESGQRACMVPLRDGMDVRRDRGARGSDGPGDDRDPGAAPDGAKAAGDGAGAAGDAAEDGRSGE
ncbi:(2Fe-2S)-binding protein [Leucobacter zeae]|nr:(2Fe-2S)-binding protein [Leucobacter zeae]